MVHSRLGFNGLARQFWLKIPGGKYPLAFRAFLLWQLPPKARVGYALIPRSLPANSCPAYAGSYSRAFSEICNNSMCLTGLCRRSSVRSIRLASWLTRGRRSCRCFNAPLGQTRKPKNSPVNILATVWKASSLHTEEELMQ